jgi:hypothetical protein
VTNVTGVLDALRMDGKWTIAFGKGLVLINVIVGSGMRLVCAITMVTI